MRKAHLHVAHCAVIAALWPEIDLVARYCEGEDLGYPSASEQRSTI